MFADSPKSIIENESLFSSAGGFLSFMLGGFVTPANKASVVVSIKQNTVFFFIYSVVLQIVKIEAAKKMPASFRTAFDFFANLILRRLQISAARSSRTLSRVFRAVFLASSSCACDGAFSVANA